MTTSFDLSFGTILFFAVVLATFYVLVSWSAGSLLLQKGTTQLGTVTSFVLGHAVLAVLIQLIVVAGLLRWYVLLPLFFGILGLKLRSVHFQKFEWKWPRDWTPQYRLTYFLMFGLALLAVLLAMATLSYPGTDALAYYLAQPKLMAATGHYTPLPVFIGFAVLPAIAEMPYAVMYVFGGDAVGLIASKLSMWPVFLAVLAMLWRCAKDLGLSVDAAWLLVAIGATSTAVTLIAWDGKTDLISLMYALGAVYCFPGLVFSNPDQRQLCTFGFFSACSIMAKISYTIILPFCIGIPLFFLWCKQPRMLFRILMIGGLTAFLAFALGWWVKNYFVFGDPFAPILSLRQNTPKFVMDQSWFNADNTRWILSTYPLALTFGLYPMQHGGISPIWMMLIPALATRPWQSEAGRKAIYLALGGVAGLIAWALLRSSVLAPRYFLPALILPSLILLAGCERWLRERRALAAMAFLATMVLLVMHVEYAYYVWRHVTQPFVTALKGKYGRTPLLDITRRLESDPRPNAKVLLLSFSSEFLPSRMLASFLTIGSIGKKTNVLDWALREKVDYIMYCPITHKRDDLDVPSPKGLLVEKLEYSPNVYYLYVLTRTNE